MWCASSWDSRFPFSWWPLPPGRVGPVHIMMLLFTLMHNCGDVAKLFYPYKASIAISSLNCLPDQILYCFLTRTGQETGNRGGSVLPGTEEEQGCKCGVTLNALTCLSLHVGLLCLCISVIKVLHYHQQPSGIKNIWSRVEHHHGPAVWSLLWTASERMKGFGSKCRWIHFFVFYYYYCHRRHIRRWCYVSI